jgi:hypothetical protein
VASLNELGFNFSSTDGARDALRAMLNERLAELRRQMASRDRKICAMVRVAHAKMQEVLAAPVDNSLEGRVAPVVAQPVPVPEVVQRAPSPQPEKRGAKRKSSSPASAPPVEEDEGAVLLANLSPNRMAAAHALAELWGTRVFRKGRKLF